MKRKRLSLLPLGLVLLALLAGLALLGGCGQSGNDSGSPDAPEAQTPVRVGIIQYVEHPSLDSARLGFLDALKQAGYVEGENLIVDYQNAQADMAIAQSIAQKFTQDAPDLILAVATPTAQAMASATKEIPILITAVTDPVGAKLVQSLEKPGGNITGTSDAYPLRDQLVLLKALVPGAKTVGLIYNNGEQNSVVQAEQVNQYARELELKVVEATPNNSGEVLQAAQSLVGKVDAIYVPSDNTVVSAIEAVVQVANEYDIPLIPGEGDSVTRGGLASLGLDYFKLGQQTGEMAIRILNGEKPGDIPVGMQDEYPLYINLKAAAEMNVQVPEDILERAEIVIK